MQHVAALVFDGKRTASKVLDALEEQATPGTRKWVDDVAVVSRGKHGFVRVNSTWAEADDAVAAGAGFGALTGALIGAMLGPGGALAGALGGGSIAGRFGMGINIAVEDPRLEEFAAQLEDDKSALILVSDRPAVADLISAVEPWEATIIETDLNEHDLNALREAIKAGQARA